ncbi:MULTISPECIES: DUF2607 family protein [Vibrio]|uniref:DUF2607 domain-containing protein n=1 Tax=Vibrio bivalvicida TaxID=1276888 RepID=A0A177Y1A5_9VIBR|nr:MULTISPECIES: DUF2607 family protein [Vibrio]KLN65448.1 hypothetical protein ZX61_09680 [Vibrio sp. VPAP30]OAJ94638.1 hypothetical protein APB76_08390 [Vibrio bivalvicida]
MLQCRLTTYRINALALSAIALVLWLNFAFIDHQYELSSTHHQDHHCQLFASGLHGVSNHTPTVAPPTIGDQFEVSSEYGFNEVVTFAYLARSPPLS